MDSATNTPFNKLAIPLRMGLLIGIFKIILSTIQYEFFVSGFISMMAFLLLQLILTIVLLIVTGNMQRKAVGGFISFGDAFAAILIAVLISSVLSFTYDYIYIKFIDPEMMDKIRESSMAFAEKMGAPQESLDEMSRKFDQQQADSINFGKQLIQLLKGLIFNIIVGLICAAIVKKKRPEHLEVQQ